MDEREIVLSAANVALDKQAQDLEIIKVSDFVDYTDYVMVCGGRSERQVRAIAEAIQKELKSLGLSLLGVEGLSQGHWVLLDAGIVVVHVFHEHARSYYDIEGLWSDAERVPIEALSKAPHADESRGRCASGS